MWLILYFCVKNCAKYQYASRAVCAYALGFRKRPECGLVGTCTLIRTNTVMILCKYILMVSVKSNYFLDKIKN